MATPQKEVAHSLILHKVRSSWAEAWGLLPRPLEATAWRMKKTRGLNVIAGKAMLTNLVQSMYRVSSAVSFCR